MPEHADRRTCSSAEPIQQLERRRALLRIRERLQTASHRLTGVVWDSSPLPSWCLLADSNRDCGKKGNKQQRTKATRTKGTHVSPQKYIAEILLWKARCCQ